MRQLEQGAAKAGDTTQFAAASTTFWLQREALSVLLYRLVAERIALRSGSTDGSVSAHADVQVALDQVRGAELVRAVEVEALIGSLALDGAASLSQIAEAAPEPWASLLREHRSALQALADELSSAGVPQRSLFEFLR